jgi:hypothetical protein
LFVSGLIKLSATFSDISLQALPVNKAPANSFRVGSAPLEWLCVGVVGWRWPDILKLSDMIDSCYANFIYIEYLLNCLLEPIKNSRDDFWPKAAKILYSQHS